MEIIDSHVHYWQPSLPDRPWDPKATQIGTPESVEEVLAAAKPAGVTKIVQVTPSIMGYDNRYAFEGADQHPHDVLGVFIRFDPLGADMAERLAKERSKPKFLGVRLTLLSPPYNAWLQDGVLEPFLAEAGKQKVPVAIYASYLEKQVGRGGAPASADADPKRSRQLAAQRQRAFRALARHLSDGCRPEHLGEGVVLSGSRARTISV